MSDEKVITPFELGVCVAMQLVGKAIAMNPHLDIEELKRDAAAVMETMPSEPKWVGGPGVHQAAIENLLVGIGKVKR
ncbi:hypothetical protein [Pseudomonas brassicacearum]|jgi:hypothetical protein|uniref:hypothetical protein n=1 Tax=Pseudomonas brassicacearum TaxID=930166 RepID=UPI0012981490|nr:hypothetical protein [Pseudomonas brassicacearum]QGA51088.1 hypothetical protein GFU70_18830 [Pseudomonas brassicacearum]